MSQSLYSFENISTLLSRAGVSPGSHLPVRRTPVAATAAPPAPTSPEDLVAAVQAVKAPSQRALGAALESVLGDLRRVLGISLFVADGDGLLLAGSGDAPTMAASMAADAMHSMQSKASFTASQVNALLLKVSSHDYLVFSRRKDKHAFVVGALVQDNLPLKALQTAAELIWETLFMRIQHA